MPDFYQQHLEIVSCMHENQEIKNKYVSSEAKGLSKFYCDGCCFIYKYKCVIGVADILAVGDNPLVAIIRRKNKVKSLLYASTGWTVKQLSNVGCHWVDATDPIRSDLIKEILSMPLGWL